jgi:hypothetical protein
LFTITGTGASFAQRRGQPGAIGHINLHRNRWNADGFRFVKHPLVLFVVSSKHCNGSSMFGQSERDAATNSAVATSHHSHSNGQVK